MKTLGLSLMLLAFCSGIVSAKEDSKKEDKSKKESHVIVLTDKNFDNMIQKNKMLMVKFYAPWCGHCKTMAPKYEKLAEELNKSKSKFKLADLDATAYRKIGEKFKVMNYPTLKFFYKGLPIDYEGPTENDDIVKFMEKKAGTAAKTVDSEKEIMELAESNEFIVVGFFKDLNSKEANTFTEAARLTSYIEFAITSDKSLMKKFGIEKYGVVAQNNFPENTGKDVKDKRKQYKGSFTRDALAKWAEEESKPIIIEYNDQTSRKVMGHEDINQHVILIGRLTGKDAISKKEKDQIMIEYAKAIEKHVGKFFFIYADANDRANHPMIHYFGKKPDEPPYFLIFNLKDVAKFHMPEKYKKITAKNIGKFIDLYLSGKAEQFYLSGELPDDWDSKPLKYIVQSNFMDVTHNKKTDAMIFYMSNECEHCGDKHEMMEKLAEEFKDSDDKVFAFINVSFNEFKDESLSTDLVPSVRIFKKNTNEMIEFQGHFSYENLKKFLLEYDVQKIDYSKYKQEDEDEDEDYDEIEDLDPSKHTEL